MDKLKSHHITMSDKAWQKLVLIAKYNGSRSVSSYLEQLVFKKRFNLK